MHKHEYISFVFQVTQASSSTNAVKSIEFARRSKSFLVNTADRVIRVYKTADVLKHKEGGGKDPEPGKFVNYVQPGRYGVCKWRRYGVGGG